MRPGDGAAIVIEQGHTDVRGQAGAGPDQGAQGFFEATESELCPVDDTRVAAGAIPHEQFQSVLEKAGQDALRSRADQMLEFSFLRADARPGLSIVSRFLERDDSPWLFTTFTRLRASFGGTVRVGW